jgi:predicted DNA-binding transcriptional regulator AlpA
MQVQSVEQVTGDRLLTTKELSEMIGVATSTINRARVFGSSNLPSYLKIGKSVRYRLSTVQRWIEQQQEYRHTTEQQAA